jgi:hypothetical protein
MRRYNDSLLHSASNLNGFLGCSHAAASNLQKLRDSQSLPDRADIQSAIGESLAWEQKVGRKKTAVRAALSRGYDDRSDWDEQDRWAIRMMQAFEWEFDSRLQASAGTEGAR